MADSGSPASWAGFSLLAQGAEARLYRGKFLGRPAIAKQRFVKRYRQPELDSRLGRERHRAEARALLRCKQVGVAVPAMLLCDTVSQTIVLEEVAGAETARARLDRLLGAGQQGAELTVLADRVGRVLATLHSHNILHGDLTTSNLLVRGPDTDPELVLIDFGLSSLEGGAEDKGVDLYVLERALLSTHPGTEQLFSQICDAYSQQGGKQAREVLAKFEEIRRRGRKRTMVG